MTSKYYAYIAWDYAGDWIDTCDLETEKECKDWDAYIKIELPLDKGRKKGICVGVVPYKEN
jgi:hypothetical protein